MTQVAAVVEDVSMYLQIIGVSFDYRKVTTSSLLVVYFQIFRRLMKGKFDAYVQ